MMRRWLAAVLGALALVLVTAPGASAHDELVSSVPASGFTVTDLPAFARVTFGEETGAKDLTVEAEGRKPTIDGHDGHVTDGVLAFHVTNLGGEGATTAAAGTRPSDPEQPLHALSVATHVVGYLAMAVLIGGLFFVSVLWPAGAGDRRTRVLLGTATAAGLASALMAVYVATEQVAPLPFRDALAQHVGRVSVATALMWLFASVVVVAVIQQPESVRKTAWRVGALAVAIGMIRSIGMSAHGTQGSHATSGIVVDFLHLAAVSAWVGGLAVMTIGLLPRRRLEELREVVPRFSTVAATSVLLIVSSGAVLAWQLMSSVGDLFSTHYGRVLLVKLSLIAAVLLIALVSKRWVDRRLTAVVAADDGSAVRTLVASVGAEAVLVTAVLAVASLLVTASPGL